MKPQLLLTRILFFLLLAFTICGLLNAKNAPDWVSQKPKSDSNYKYYIGRASDSKTEAQGFSEAYRDAVEQSIRENYGVKAKIDTQTYSTNEKIELTKRASETSGEVQLNNFELIDSWVDKNKKDKYNVWIQYKYPVFEIEKEKIRLASFVEKKEIVDFQDAGSSQVGVASQPFEIVTEPAGAKVYLDGQLLLVRTPLKINIENGEHSIQIDRSNYKNISEKIIAVESKTKRLEYKLEPSYGKLNVETAPSGAMVFIDGKPIGESPLYNISVLSGKEAIVQIRHSEAETSSQTIKLEKDEIRRINPTLLLKPAKLNITTDPTEGVTVSINGKEEGSTPLKTMILEPGTYTVALSKENYETETQSINLAGNETKTLETIKLNKMSSVSIDSNPNGAEIKLDGTEMGTTPLKDFQISKGTHRLCLTKNEYSEKCVSVNLEPGQSFSETYTLEELPENEFVKRGFRPWDLTLGVGYTFSSSASSNQYFDKSNNGTNIMLGGEKVLTSTVGVKLYMLGSLNAIRGGSYEFYTSFPIYLHGFFSSFKHYCAVSPLLGYQPYNLVRLSTGYGAETHQFFYGLEAEYRYYLDQNPIKGLEMLLGPGLLFGYKRYSVTGNSIYVAATISLRMW